MLLFGLLLALPVTAVAATVVYRDATRRDLPRTSRLRWTAGVAAASAAGFAFAFGFESWVVRTLLASAPSPSGVVVVTSPMQALTTLFAVGLAVSAAAVLAYGVGSRYGPFAAA